MNGTSISTVVDIVGPAPTTHRRQRHGPAELQHPTIVDVIVRSWEVRGDVGESVVADGNISGERALCVVPSSSTAATFEEDQPTVDAIID